MRQNKILPQPMSLLGNINGIKNRNSARKDTFMRLCIFARREMLLFCNYFSTFSYSSRECYTNGIYEWIILPKCHPQKCDHLECSVDILTPSQQSPLMEAKQNAEL